MTSTSSAASTEWQWRGKTTWLLALGAVLWWLFDLEGKDRLNDTWGARVPIDFLVYYRAGSSLLFGHDLYATDFVRGLPFTYPPFAGALFTILARWPAVTAATMWQVASFCSMIAVMLAVARERKVHVNAPVALIAVALACSAVGLDAIRGTFFFGQINLLLMLLVAVDILPRHRPWAGVGVGLAAGIKLTPGFFLLYFVLERNWRALVAAVATFGATVWIGYRVVPDADRFWREAIFESSRIGVETNPGAQSIKAVLTREFGGVPEPVWLLLVVIAVVLCTAGVLRSQRLGNRTFAMVLTGFTAALISPFSWFHHWVWVVPLMMCVACVVAEKWEGLRLRLGLKGVLGWVFSQLGSAVGVALLGALLIPYYSKEALWKLGFLHQSVSPNVWWRQSFLLAGVVLVAGYGLFAIARAVMTGRIRHPRQWGARWNAPGPSTPERPLAEPVTSST